MTNIAKIDQKYQDVEEPSTSAEERISEFWTQLIQVMNSTPSSLYQNVSPGTPIGFDSML